VAAYRTAADRLAGARYVRQLAASELGTTEIQAFLFTGHNGRPLLVAFTDHGQALGKKSGGNVVRDRERDLVVGEALLPGWTGRVRLTDFLGAQREESGDGVSVHLTYRPLYVEVLDP
jgi:hypothetical protein